VKEAKFSRDAIAERFGAGAVTRTASGSG